MINMKSFCATCNRQQVQTVLKEVEEKEHNSEDGWWEESTFQIIKCGGCETISFRKLHNNIAWQSQSEDDTTMQELYPKRNEHSRSVKSYRKLPESILIIYQQSLEAFNSNLRILCGAGIRAIIEGICLDKNIKNGKVEGPKGIRTSNKLDGKISGLFENGFLTKPNSEILHEIRFLGNDAIHELKEPTIEELSLAIDIIELVIDSIYIIEEKAKALKRHRAAKKEKKMNWVLHNYKGLEPLTT